jgi:hypothetical protein
MATSMAILSDKEKDIRQPGHDLKPLIIINKIAITPEHDLTSCNVVDIEVSESSTGQIEYDNGMG